MKIRGKQGDDITVDMSPMIDLVFLLLIFFLVASQIVKVDKIPIQVPEAVYAKVPEDETGRFAITVRSGGDMFIGAEAEKVSLDQLSTRLAGELDANKDLKVVIRADKTVKFETTEKIMAACGEAGAMDLTFAAFEK